VWRGLNEPAGKTTTIFGNFVGWQIEMLVEGSERGGIGRGVHIEQVNAIKGNDN